MADAFREITSWAGNDVKNGVYLMAGDKCFAFCNYKGEITTFAKPLQIDKRGRKFEKVQNLFDVKVEADPALIAVAGSKGATYYVDPKNKTCTCPGFTFRGKCKHTEAV